MGVVSLRDIVGPAFDARYGVPAVYIFNDLSMEAVLAAAVEANSPMILQTSVKTVRTIRSHALFRLRAQGTVLVASSRPCCAPSSAHFSGTLSSTIMRRRSCQQ
ncbi:class II fructose-bisphosphate aldolase [Cryobacterium sp. Y57]|uniref:class II fructose-bisphosphate aldolase n=1 Tax=Cryobacterium sp. Y57 TaxID=2048287 RepID=UPI000CE458ED|nr:class II fructose-bisphosphate aldolase [Cryobacterium sp. Y57]